MEKDKKIGIITYHSANNYGAMLQVYALQEVVKKYEKDVYIIDYRNEKVENNYKIFKFHGKNPIRLVKQLVKNLKNLPQNYRRNQKFINFKNTYMSLSKDQYKSQVALKNNPPDYDVYITGSDQVWSTHITGELEDAYALNFGKDTVKRISYAASIGKSKIEEKDKEQYQKKLAKMDCISVREDMAKEELQKLISKDIEVVLDPTLLMNTKEWDKIANQSQEKIRGEYILVYELLKDDRIQKIVEMLKRKTNLKIVSLKSLSIKKEDIDKDEYVTGPIEFVSLIKNAKYVVTNSFHGTVFSILYEKEFFVVPPQKTGARMVHLLEKLELKEKMLTEDEIEQVNLAQKTDYKKVKGILEKERQQSIKFLVESIKNKCSK